MGLKTTSVSKCLDKKILFFGFEILHVLFIFLVLSVLNLVFGQTSLKIVMVWLPTLAVALILRLGKNGKPENFIAHWLRFQIRPGVLRAFPESSHYSPPPKLAQNGCKDSLEIMRIAPNENWKQTKVSPKL